MSNNDAPNQSTDDRPGPGWHNICRECFGCLIEWPGMRRCECEQEKRRSVSKDAISQTTPKRRTVLQHNFEGGGAMYVDVWGDVEMRDVLWALRELMALKERELQERTDA